MGESVIAAIIPCCALFLFSIFSTVKKQLLMAVQFHANYPFFISQSECEFVSATGNGRSDQVVFAIKIKIKNNPFSTHESFPVYSKLYQIFQSLKI